MAVTLPQFWNLLAESRLLSARKLEELKKEFEAKHPEGRLATSRTAAQWLITRKQITRYQATVLLAGRSGPFFYGEYRVYGHVEEDRLQGFFRALHDPTRHRVMLQFLGRDQLKTPGHWESLVARTTTLSQIEDPHLVRYHEAVELDPYRFLVLEELRGRSVAAQLAQGKLPPAKACRFVREAASGLAALHAHGVVHGDVRPVNLWLQAAGESQRCKLYFDPLGGSIAEDDAGRLTQAEYQAPELAFPGRQPDPLTDIYSLGCTLYQMLSGQLPFPGGTLEEKARRHATEPIRPLEKFGVPQPIGQLVAYMMAKNPAVRYQQAAVVAEQLAEFCEPAETPEPAEATASWEAYEKALHARRRELAMTPLGSAPAAWVEPEAASVSSAAGHPDPMVVPTATRTAPAIGPGPVITTPTLSPAPTLAIAPERTGTAAAIERLRQRKRRSQMLFWSTVGGLLLGVLVGSFYYWNRGREQTAGPAPPPANTVTDPQPGGETTEQTAVAANEPRGPVIVPDDGRLLWASPTAGSAVRLNYVPPGAQVLLIARPAELLSHPEGPKLLRALGPRFETLRSSWETQLGVRLEEIELLVLGWHDQPQGAPRPSFVVYLKEPRSSDELLAGWGHPAAKQGEGESKYYVGNNGCYLVPDQPEGPSFVAGAEPEIAEVAQFGGAPPPLRREIALLHQTTDQQRHLTMLFAPSYLLTDGRELLASYDGKLLESFDWLMGDAVKAGLFSLHLADVAYCELRLEGTLDVDEHWLADELRARLDEMPDKVESYLVRLNPHPYWRVVAFRYPQMVRFFQSQLRVGVEGDQVVANAVLPSVAAHNLVFGAEMALASTPGAAAVAATPRAAQGPQTLEELLQQKTSLSFDQQSLEFALRDLANQVRDTYPALPFRFQISIVGEDLGADGITRNQQIQNFQQQNQTLADILTAIVRKANPVTTVQDPSEPDQKLLWVIAPDPENPAQRIVLITTRQAATAKGYELPAVFGGRAS